MGRVEGKVALVTGGASGIGKVDCELLASEGARVVVADVDKKGADAVAAGIGDAAISMHLDVTSEQAWRDAMQTVEKEFGGLHILVNNAGVVIPGTVEDVSLEDFRLQMSVSAEGVFLGCKHGISLMKKSGGGSIINMSSMAALRGFPPFLAYSGAKGAVWSMTKSIAVHCQDQEYGIRCNSIHPGGIATPMLKAVGGPTSPEEVQQTGVLPTGATGTPMDIASLVLYLASDESRFVTASEFVVDNGAIQRP